MRQKKQTHPHLQAELIPLVIGVTGHRDLRPEDISDLEGAVAEVFETLRKRYKNTPLLVLSPLAEGADRLVARVARKADIGLIVPLPIAPELYERDFADDASRAEFRGLLNYAESSFTLPKLTRKAGEKKLSAGEARDKQYEQVGAYVVRHCEILLALWDGEDSSLTGGTSRIVDFQLEGVPEPYAPPRNFFDEVNSGPVYHLVTPRLKGNSQKGHPFTIKALFPASHTNEAKAKKEKAFQQKHENIDTFNFNVTRISGERTLTQSKAYLFPEAEAQNLPAFMRSLRDRYAIADSLAIHFRKMTDWTLRVLYGLVFLAAIVFDVYAHLAPDRHGLLFGYLLIMGAAYTVVYRRAKKAEYENKYQDYRALAEGMRVQFFWALANLRISVAEHYLRKQRSELDWICTGISAWTVPLDIEGWSQIHSNPVTAARLKLILKHWLKAEAKFYRDRAEQEKKRLEKYEPWTRYFLILTVGLAILLVLALWLSHPWRQEWQEWLHKSDNFHHILIIFLSLLPVAAALLHSYLEKAAFSEHLKQYSRMRAIFSNAEKHLSALIEAKKPEEAQRAVESLGKEALIENGDWVLLHRERPLEMIQ